MSSSFSLRDYMDLDEFLNASELCLELASRHRSFEDVADGNGTDAEDNEFDVQLAEASKLQGNSQVMEAKVKVLSVPTSCATWLQTAVSPSKMPKGMNMESVKEQRDSTASSDNDIKEFQLPCGTFLQTGSPVSPTLSTSNSLETDEGQGESIFDSDEGRQQSSGSNDDIGSQGGNSFCSSVDENPICSEGKQEVKRRLSKKRSKSGKNVKGAKDLQKSPTRKRKSQSSDFLDYNPTPVTRKRKRKNVPEELKDIKYWERREKNNVAAKRSRDTRREKECCIKERVVELEEENSELRDKVEKLKTKLASTEQKLKEKELISSIVK